MPSEACEADELDIVSESFGRRQFDMHLQKAQTEIAVLHIKVNNLEDKIEEVRKEISSLRDHIDKNNESIRVLIREMRETSVVEYHSIGKKVTDIEKWRYMLIGGGIILGSIGFDAVKALFSM